MDIGEDIFSVSENYDTLFVDVYGVLFDGQSLYEGTLETLNKLRKGGKKIVILSNTTQLSADAEKGYSEIGMIKNVHYDYFITSGSFLHYTLTNNKNLLNEYIGKSFSKVKCMFIGNSNIFDDTGISKADTFEEADFVYVTAPRSSYGAVRIDSLSDENDNLVTIEDFLYRNWMNLKDDQGRKGLSEFAIRLEMLSKINKPLLIANSDIFAPCGIDGGRYPIITQGGIGAYYEKFYKGKAVYFGKPHVGIFEFARNESLSEKDRIIMVGDTIWTDILGAQQLGIDSALVITGVTGEFFSKIEQRSISKKLEILLENIGPKFSVTSEKLSAPTYLLKHFYEG